MTIPSEAIDALRRGNKIEAIKLTREQTGLGLKESKDAVEQVLASDAAIREAYQARAPKGQGCLPVIIVLLLMFAALYYWFFGNGD